MIRHQKAKPPCFNKKGTGKKLIPTCSFYGLFLDRYLAADYYSIILHYVYHVNTIT
jgi:hypothetical protein